MSDDRQLRALPSVDRLARAIARRRRELAGGGGRARGCGRAPLARAGAEADALRRARLCERRAGAGERLAVAAATTTSRRCCGSYRDRGQQRRRGGAARDCGRAGAGGAVAVSRGQLVEIGGGFRTPDVLAQAGARMVEVGTTNRTRLPDYERALTAADGGATAILCVHQSNVRAVSFVEEVAIEPLCELGVPVIDDIGSGTLTAGLDALADEPLVARSIAAGAAVV